MSRVLLDDLILWHQKTLAVGEAGWCLWMASLVYCNRYVTDGFIPGTSLCALHPWGSRTRDDLEQVARLLVRNGVWVEVEGGWQVANYEEHQPHAMRVEVEARREQWAAKKRGQRERGRTRLQRVSTEVSPRGHLSCPRRVPHVSPGGHSRPETSFQALGELSPGVSPMCPSLPGSMDLTHTQARERARVAETVPSEEQAQPEAPPPLAEPQGGKDAPREATPVSTSPSPEQARLEASLRQHDAFKTIAHPSRLAARILGDKMARGTKLEWLVTAIADCALHVGAKQDAGSYFSAEWIAEQIVRYCANARAPREAAPPTASHAARSAGAAYAQGGRRLDPSATQGLHRSVSESEWAERQREFDQQRVANSAMKKIRAEEAEEARREAYAVKLEARAMRAIGRQSDEDAKLEESRREIAAELAARAVKSAAGGGDV